MRVLRGQATWVRAGSRSPHERVSSHSLSLVGVSRKWLSREPFRYTGKILHTLDTVNLNRGQPNEHDSNLFQLRRGAAARCGH